MKKYSKILLTAVVIISLFGTLMIYSSSYVWAEYKFNDPYKYLKSQSIFLILGYIVMFIVSKFPYQNYKKLSNIIFFICLGMLALVLIPGIGTVRNGSRSWFGIGSLGLQPSEFAKLGLIKKDRDRYFKTQPDREVLINEVFLYALMKYFEEKSKDSVGIDELLNAPLSPGRVLNLKRIALNEYLDNLAALNYITVNRTAGLDMVYLKKNIPLNEIVEKYYEKN